MNFKDDEMRQIGTAYMITQSNQFVGNFLQIIYLVSVYFIWFSFGSSFGSPVYTFFGTLKRVWEINQGTLVDIVVGHSCLIDQSQSFKKDRIYTSLPKLVRPCS